MNIFGAASIATAARSYFAENFRRVTVISLLALVDRKSGGREIGRAHDHIRTIVICRQGWSISVTIFGYVLNKA